MSQSVRVGERMRFGAVAAAWYDSVEAAFGQMQVTGLNAIPVVNDQRVIGLIERSAVRACQSGGNWLGSVSVASLMRRGVVTCQAGDSVAQALATMDRLEVNLLAVIDKVGQMIGVIGRDAIVEPTRMCRVTRSFSCSRKPLPITSASRGGRELFSDGVL
jgi:predicted transcriptional regulator